MYKLCVSKSGKDQQFTSKLFETIQEAKEEIKKYNLICDIHLYVLEEKEFIK